jgi:hypothetical protein
VEISLPYLVWTRLRPWIVIGGFLLHFGVGLFMGLLVFSLFMMVMLASYIPGWAIRERIFGKPGTTKALKPVSYDPTDDAQCKYAAWKLAWDLDGTTTLAPRGSV